MNIAVWRFLIQLFWQFYENGLLRRKKDHFEKFDSITFVVGEMLQNVLLQLLE